MFVTGRAADLRCPGMPQRIISSWRSPSTARMIGGTHVGEDARERRQVACHIARRREEAGA